MVKGRRKFQRQLGERRYHKLIVIAAEGSMTEPQYFALFRDLQAVIQVHCLKGKSSSPPHVLKRMNDHLKREALKPTDEAWLVVDKDLWTEAQLRQLNDWAQEKANRGFALSNPKFEYWLLLHFEDGLGISSSQECSDRLKRYLPGYDKKVTAHNFTKERIAEALRRARQRDSPPCADWPRTLGCTTVYRLVERILLSQNQHTQTEPTQ